MSGTRLFGRHKVRLFFFATMMHTRTDAHRWSTGGIRYVQACATPPHLLDNLHFMPPKRRFWKTKQQAMWETTFPRNSHAGLGRDFTEIHPYSKVCSVRKMACPIRRGYFSEMLFPTWTAGRACLFELLCEGVSTRFGLRMLAKSLEKTRQT